MPSLLPNAKAQFVDANGLPLVGGTVGYYSPSTLNPLPTYQDQAGTIANTNPISLDSRGQAIIWGSGVFRQIVKDINGVTIWDQIVASADSAFTGNSGASLIGFDSTNLANILTTRLNRVVDSIAALRSLSKVLYTRAFVTGYYAPHDGGGGAYQYDPADTTSADNSGTVIVASDGGRWKLQHKGVVSVCQFGARGTSVTGGTLVDDTAAFNAAVATGLTVRIPRPTTYFRLTNAVTMTTAGQVIYGDGCDVSIVQIDSSFTMSAVGVFVFNTPAPWSPQLRDFKITAIQPDTATYASLTQYPPLVYAQGQPRYELVGMQITQGINAIDMRGNSGGCVIDRCKISAYLNHVIIDGAQDSVKISNTHFWPFDMTTNQTTILTAAACNGIQTNRCDDLSIDNCLIYCGTKIIAGLGGTGNTFGKVTNTSLDNGRGVVMSSGNLTFSACYFSVGNGSPQWVSMTGGALARFNGCDFSVGVAGTQNLMTITGAGTASIFSGCSFQTGGSDQTMLIVSTPSGEASAQFNNCVFNRTPGVNWASPTLLQGAGGQLIVTGCTNSPKGGGVGVFVAIGVDDAHVISDNSFNGWQAITPASYSLMKFDNNTNISPISGGDFISNFLVGNLRTKVFYGTATAGGTFVIAHGISGGQQKVVSCMGLSRNSGGGAAPMTLTAVDGTNASFSGATASAAVRVTIQYTETQQGW